MVDSLEEAKATGRLDRRLNTLTHPSLPVVDEIGYLPVTRSGAILFFQLINRCYGRASTVLTSNQGFEEWGRIGADSPGVRLLETVEQLLQTRSNLAVGLSGVPGRSDHQSALADRAEKQVSHRSYR